MKDAFAAEAAAHGDDEAIRDILRQACRITHMGFAAVARVTEDRWIACQVEDRIEFGLDPGSELEIKTTICNDIRQCGTAIVIDHVAADPEWRTHPVPMLYGFESYASLPIILADGSFYGTLCAIDPAPRVVTAPDTVAALQSLAEEVAAILSRKMGIAIPN
ncbi:GAF domain-containing protein [Allosphingosinicella flava]|uniref:GAF domain-containing protein n=1 Tax=Allosphingosinicella flava TaxID=2771430 RepID=A0A7T2GL78_9SPHN|nr:GAF domain-containing protein [Sphingosinicella flava]QPQ55832.1 GAF domain-containing protein [Sphingosinicella flava]